MSLKKNFLLSKLVLFVLSIFPISSYALMTLKDANAYDGDTIKTNIIPINGLQPLTIRIYGIDTPELKGECEEERRLAKQAKDRLNKIIYDGINIEPVKWDKYGGRFVANVFTLKGENISKILISEGLAKEYYGGKKPNWCNKK